MTLRKRGRVWYVSIPLPEGGHLTRSTRRTDRADALLIEKRLLREHADPEHAALQSATLEDVVALFLESRQQDVDDGTLSPETLHMYRTKAGVLIRLLGQQGGDYFPFRLANLSAATVDDYCKARRREGVKQHTVVKELTTLRQILRLAKRRRLWKDDLDAVMPGKSPAVYEPVKRFLTEEQLDKLLAALSPRRGARVAFMVATSANASESARAKRSHVHPDGETVFVDGQKTQFRARHNPVLVPALKKYLAYALQHGDGEGDQLFSPWTNMNRDIGEACVRAGIPHCSSNDFRRTCATWMLHAGIPRDVISSYLGHGGPAMVQRVYGRETTEYKRDRLKSALKAAELLAASTKEKRAVDAAEEQAAH